ncbi:methyltransferase domain-containing protein [Arenibacter aquaticus]|uniref:Methyltransferase domain-containing protein n=1 Tax=Arenibacter aquaticus TaxID=2489054 RepID=A0A3S0C4M6_9FLAO|nr:methyltransferase domain-containing protein [Arenibacter aquaticus]RTE52076.1 methyltransferase domain-containing protein [Arenibacter aquaticus]
MNFKERSTEPEAMDSPKMDPLLLKKIYADINKVNKVLLGFSITIKAIKRIMKKYPRNSYTILDMGCGDGAMLREIALHFKNKAVVLKLVGIDINSKSIELAKEASKDYHNIQFKLCNILDVDEMGLQCDILLCTLTLHHFKSSEIPIFIDQFTKLSRLATIINDLQRSKASYYLFILFSLIFIKTNIAKKDGLISIKRSFTKTDLVAFSKSVPSHIHEIKWKWAFRYLWIIRKQQNKVTYE